MKIAAVVSAAALVALSGSATAFEPVNNTWGAAYLSIPFDGGTRAEREPSYGFGMVRTDVASFQVTSNILSGARLVDVKFQKGALETVTLNRQTFVWRDSETGRLNAFGDMDDPLTWVAAGVAVVGVACLAEWGICDGGGSNAPIRNVE